MPLLVQVLCQILHDAVARRHHPLLHLLLQVVVPGLMTMLVGIPQTTADLTPTLVGTVVGIGSTVILRRLPQHPFQQRIVVLGTTRMCVLTVVSFALPMLAIARLVAVIGCLQVLRCWSEMHAHRLESFFSFFAPGDCLPCR